MAARRGATAVITRPFAACPLIVSTRLNSSNDVVFSHFRQRPRRTSAADALSALIPVGVSASRLPLRAASPPACSSKGQAKARIGPIS